MATEQIPEECVSDRPLPAEGEPFIAFENVSKSFGTQVVLDSVSFSVNTGETLCILGRSGVGKSVSLQILMGFLQADSGRVTVAGKNICGYSEQQLLEIRQQVTMVFQNGALFDSLPVGENVAFSMRERGGMSDEEIDAKVTQLLEMVGLPGMQELMPSDLSTGMKRSVAIARALAARPQAVLYDEPTTMVDPIMAHLLTDLIQRLKKQVHLTSIVVTHDMQVAKQLADRVVFLHNARVHFHGSVAEMESSTDPVVRQFLDLDALILPVVDVNSR